MLTLMIYTTLMTITVISTVVFLGGILATVVLGCKTVCFNK